MSQNFDDIQHRHKDLKQASLKASFLCLLFFGIFAEIPPNTYLRSKKSVQVHFLRGARIAPVRFWSRSPEVLAVQSSLCGLRSPGRVGAQVKRLCTCKSWLSRHTSALPEVSKFKSPPNT